MQNARKDVAPSGGPCSKTPRQIDDGRMLNRSPGKAGRPAARRTRPDRPPASRPVTLAGIRLSRRLLIRLCRFGQAACLLASLSGTILIITSAPAAHAQGGCQSVCMGENADIGSCTWCERLEHGAGNGTLAAGSLLVLAGLTGAISLGQLCHGLQEGARAAT